MADKKISQLSDASTPLAGTEVLPIVQSGSTVKVASDNLTVKNVRSNATSGILQIVGPAAAATRTMTVPDANFTAARTDAGQTFTGVQVMTSPNVVTSINDTNSNEVIGISATASAVNEITIANAATGNAPTISATGSDTNIGLTLTPKGTGNTTVTSGNIVVGTAAKGIDFSANTGAAGETGALLNWYEEGTFTTSMTCGTSGTITLDSNENTLAYTRIGRVVYISGQIAISSVGSPTGTVTLNNLPFASASLPQRSESAIFNVLTSNTTTNTPTFVGRINTVGATAITIVAKDDTGALNSSPASLFAASDLWISGFYLTS